MSLPRTPVPDGGRPAAPALRRGMLLSWAACAALAAGCAETPRSTVPTLATPTAFKGAGSAPGGQAPGVASPSAWWQVFGDPALDALVERAEYANTDIAQAAARLAQARALQQAGVAAHQPQLGLQAGLNRQGGPLVNAAGDSGTLATALLGLSAEIDLSGRTLLAGRAATLDVEARESMWHAVRLQVQADVAEATLGVRMLDAEARLLDQELQLARSALAVTEARLRLGTVAERELERQRADVAERAAAAPELARRRELQLHALALLVGEPASSFQPPEGLAPEPPGSGAALPAATIPRIPAGLPSEMLQRRADVQAAARSLAAAQARAGAAQAAWFPSLQLTAAAGQASTDLRSLLQGAMSVWSVGALMALPLLDGGRREAQVAQAQAEVQAAEAAWRGQVLQAFREVEDPLSRLAELQARHALQQSAEDAAHRVADLTDRRRESGMVSELEWGRVQADWLRTRQRGWQLRAEQARATVALIRALGGGWPAQLQAGSAPPEQVQAASAPPAPHAQAQAESPPPAADHTVALAR